MSLRDEFEKLFPVPETLELVGDFYHLKPDFDHWVNVPTEAEYNAKWQGFQAGHDCWEGYWVTWERWPAKFGAERKDFEPLPPPPY